MELNIIVGGYPQSSYKKDGWLTLGTFPSLFLARIFGCFEHVSVCTYSSVCRARSYFIPSHLAGNRTKLG
jgi:hypothetical protein